MKYGFLSLFNKILVFTIFLEIQIYQNFQNLGPENFIFDKT